jgi:hypothetical protein
VRSLSYRERKFYVQIAVEQAEREKAQQQE